MNINEEFPSKYLKPGDLKGQTHKVKIKDVRHELIKADRKLMLFFVEKQKGMVLNKTNANTIARQFGVETDNRLGVEIELFAAPVEYQGQMVEGLRVRIPVSPVGDAVEEIPF